ncbi:hypothetical protein LR48_Vigan01g078400 [Vigna angularis]|uniref:Uncharacterized protein n=1 Tax=Phaseolus angularis TaxID=3914 RepID=A0A0L9TM38_PHAAN|nr:hypothetical protein LR48_Vigan01g078400 [Vigna angularis]
MAMKNPKKKWFKLMTDNRGEPSLPTPSVPSSLLVPSRAVTSNKSAETIVKETVVAPSKTARPPSPEGKRRTNLKESRDEVAALKLKLEEEMTAHSQSKKKHAETTLLLANIEGTMADIRRFGHELQTKNDELAKTNEEHIATNKLLKEQNAKLLDHGKHLGTAYRDARFQKALTHIPLLLNASIDGAGFDVMRDLYQGKLVPLKEILDEEFVEEAPSSTTEEKVEGEALVEVPANENIVQENPVDSRKDEAAHIIIN